MTSPEVYDKYTAPPSSRLITLAAPEWTLKLKSVIGAVGVANMPLDIFHNLLYMS